MVSRRNVLRTAASVALVRLILPSALGLNLAGCRKGYVRPAGLHNLGQVQHRLFPRQHVRDRAIFLFRDDKGWSAMSTSCTYDGCDLTYQDQVFLCSCCRSVFSIEGDIVRGPAADILPRYKIFYRDNNLYADSGKSVGRDYRFTTPEIEKAIGALRERIKREGILPQDNIPPILFNGQGVASDVPVTPRTQDLGMKELLDAEGATSSADGAEPSSPE